MANSVSVRVGAPGAKQASSDVDQLRDSFTKLRAEGAKGLAIGAGVAIAQQGIQMLGSTIEDVIGGSINAYRDQEVAQTRLNQTLKENVTGWNGDMSAIQAATAASEQLGFTNTETTESLSTLVGATHDVAQSLNILSVAQDLARYRNISLSDAVDALTKIEGGSYRILKSLGIDLPKGTTQVEALTAVMKVAGGQAQEFAQTDLGKLDVATAKVDAAQEKLGETMSKIGAVVIPAAADALTGAVDGIQNAGASWGTSIGDDIVWLGRLTGVIHGTSPEIQAQTARTNALTAANDGAAESGSALGESTATLAEHTKALSDRTKILVDVDQNYAQATRDAEAAAAAAAPPLSKLLTIAPLLAREVSNAATQFTDLGTSLDSALFGKAELMGNIASAQMGLNAVLKQEPQKHSGDAWAVWQGQVAQARQALFDLQYQQEQSAGPTALLAWLKKQDATFGKTNTTAHDYLVTLENLAKFQITSGNDVGVSLRPGVQARAAGGPVVPGRDYLVGEDGPELLQMGSAGGNVKPLGGRAAVPSTAAPSSGGDVLTINVITPVATPGSMEALARYLEPILTRRQQRRGVIALGVR